MEERSSTFMTLGTALGMLIALIISGILMFAVGNYENAIPFLFIGFGIVFRVIGYGLDRIVDKHKK